MVGEFSVTYAKDVRSRFTSEDRKILLLLAECSDDAAVARQLVVSMRTARRRIARVMELLGTRNRFGAGVAAASLGLIDCRPSIERDPADMRQPSEVR